MAPSHPGTASCQAGCGVFLPVQTLRTQAGLWWLTPTWAKSHQLGPHIFLPAQALRTQRGLASSFFFLMLQMLIFCVRGSAFTWNRKSDWISIRDYGPQQISLRGEDHHALAENGLESQSSPEDREAVRSFDMEIYIFLWFYLRIKQITWRKPCYMAKMLIFMLSPMVIN